MAEDASKGVLAKVEDVSPESKSCCLSKIFFTWVWHLLKIGNARSLEHEDLLPLRKTEKADHVLQLWEAALAGQQSRGEGLSVKNAIKTSLGRRMAWAGLLRLINTFVQVVPFIFMREFLVWMRDAPTLEDGKEMWEVKFHWETHKGYILIFGIFLCMQLKAIVENLYMHTASMAGLQLRSMLVQAVFRKSLRLSMQARQGFTTGEIVNLMQLWALKLEMFTFMFHTLWDGAVQIISYVSLGIWLMGPAALFGFFVMLVIAPLTGICMKKIAGAKRKVAEVTDRRVKMVNEILQGIRAIKMYAWEDPYGKEIEAVRKSEISYLKQISVSRGGMRGIMSASTNMILLALFAAYALIFEETMAPERVFTAMAVFMNVRITLVMYPFVLAQLVDAKIALRRYRTFLSAMETDPYVKVEGAVGSLSVKGGSFSYRKPGVVVLRDGFDPDPKKPKKGCFSCCKKKKQDQIAAEPAKDAEAAKAEGDKKEEGEERLEVLRNVNVEAAPGELVAVIGPVGSGKTSLAHVLLGELCRLDGEVSLHGNCAYAPQSPWIINASVKDNILFGCDYEEARYNAILDCCQLRADLKQLQSGDSTEIGERGINLSGGQKQRVSLARALYAKADIYIFDDPLSALDAEVGRAVFEQAILKFCSGSTRIFMTHAIHTLPQCDKVVQLGLDSDGAGHVVKVSTPDQLTEAEKAELARQVSAEKDDGKEGEAAKDAAKVETKKPEAAAAGSAGGGSGPAPDKLVKKEGKEEGRVKFKVYTSYILAVKSMGLVLGTLFLNIANRVITDMSAFWLAHWTQDEFELEQWVYASVYGGITVLIFVSAFVCSLSLVAASTRASKNLHGQLYNALVRAPLSFFDTTPIGRVINRFAQDMQQMDDMLPEQLSMFLMVMLSVIGMVASMAVAMPWFSIFVPVFALVYFSVVRTYQSTMRDVKRLDSVALSPIYASFQQALGGLTTIRAYGRESSFASENSKLMENYSRANYSVKSLQRWLSVRLETIGAVMLLVVGELACYQRSGTNAGYAGVAVTYALQITGLLNWTVRTLSEVEAVMSCVERILEYTSLESEKPYSLEDKGAAAQGIKAAPADWPAKGNVQLDKVELRYRPNTPLVLKGLSLDIKTGERIGVIGRTGSGKSTLMLSLLRLVEAEGGKITMDGVDAGTLALGTLRSAISIVPQDATLWSGHLRKNLDPFSKSTDVEIWSALEKVELKTSLESRFPNTALDRIDVSEYGENFSQGQRQLFCLVRALLRDSKILLMDEATSALDHETDALIQQSIRANFQGRTILVVAHRLRTVADCDRIAVLRAGELAEFAPPAELLQKPDGEFKSLVNELGKEEAAEIMRLANGEKASLLATKEEGAAC
eukprot:TRINITY_DN273_c0_g1_i1.p1 TRINITY_DN273_c0_g1~~TRINITY_DN273_c0_g1_i1.p1  ORF type:complete len:1364 (+),score=417.09 TRINITY_DN273_c0_g1_i1:74-4165(+)